MKRWLAEMLVILCDTLQGFHVLYAGLPVPRLQIS
jgi:hypothetical protein